MADFEGGYRLISQLPIRMIHNRLDRLALILTGRLLDDSWDTVPQVYGARSQRNDFRGNS